MASETRKRALIRVFAIGAAGIATVGVLAGCWSGGSETGGSATTTTATRAFDVCGIDPSVLRQAGVDPTTKSADTVYTNDCSWDGSAYGLSAVPDPGQTLDDLPHQHPLWRNFTHVTIAGRQGLRFNQNGDLTGECSIAFSVAGNGVVALLVQKNPFTEDPRGACEMAQAAAAAIVPVLPK
jgi:hypothetical protein